MAPQEQNTKEPSEKDEVELTRRGGRTLSPLMLTILGGIGTALLAIFNNWFQWFQMQSAETLKLRATLIQKALEPPTAEERKKNLVFLVTAGLITDPGGKIKNLKLEEIPRGFTFVASTALTPELRTRLDNALQDFRNYAQSIGLRIDSKPQVAILEEKQMKNPGMLAFYDGEAPGGPELVINARYADDPDLALREYCHHLLATSRPAGPPKYEGDFKNYSAHFAIESALAFYLPCSSDNNPQFAHILLQRDANAVPSVNFSRKRNLNELKGDLESAYYEDAEIWGSLFWELRTRFGPQKMDGLLARAWFTLNENAPAAAQNKAFAAAIIQAASPQLGAAAAAEIKAIFTARGLVL